MKKKYIRLLAAAVVLAGLIGAFLWLQATPEAEEPVPEAEKIYVTGAPDGPGPAEIMIRNEHGAFSIINKATGENAPELTIESWESFSLDSYALFGAFNAARSMEAKQVISENPTDEALAAFGLNSPRANVIISSAGEGKTDISFGNDAPGGEGAYVQRNGVVYLVSPSAANPFTRPATDYINRAVTEAGADFEMFDRVVITGTLYPEPIVIERSPDTELEAGGMVFGTHRITSPLEIGVSMKGIEMLQTLYSITAEQIEAVGDDADTLKKFGLHEPDMSIDVTGPGDGYTFTLRVSKGDDGHIHLKKNAMPIIYGFHDGMLPWFGAMLFDLMDRTPMMPFIDTVSRVTVKTPETAWVFDISGEGNELVITHGGEELDAKNFRTFYQTLISAHYTEEIPDYSPIGPPDDSNTETPESIYEANDGLEERDEPRSLLAAPDNIPILEIEYQYRGGAPADTVRFFPGPVRRAIISVNGGKSFYTVSSYVDRVLEDAVKVANGEEVKSFF